MYAKPRNLREIFDAQCRYMVPLYQRPYVWSKHEQWEPLWEDIVILAERYLHQLPFVPHFMGAVVLDQLSFATGTLDLRQIIDGQQRLTTLQIVIEAASDVCESLGSVAAYHARDLRRLTRNDQRGGDPDEIFKVWPTNVDREHFRVVMRAGTEEEVRTHYDGKSNTDLGFAIANSYIFFHKKIKEWLSSDNETLLKNKLDALQNAIYWGLVVVVIDLDEKDNAQMIFETLNARGTPLLASDLVKNFLLHRAEEYHHDLETFYTQYWEFFDSSPFWREKVPAGRVLRPQIELFLQHYITLLTRDEVLVTNLFNTFRQFVKKYPEVDPGTYMAALHRYGVLYQKFYTYPANTREGLFFHRIRALETTTIYPLLLIVFDKLGTPAYDNQRRAILTDLESFLVRRMVCELSTKNYNNLFLEAVKQFSDCPPGELEGRIREYLQNQDSDISRWPDDIEFLKAWQTIEAYKRFKPQTRLRMILEALELQRRAGARTEDRTLPNQKLSIEHILPRGWTDANWPLPEDTDEARERRERLLHTMGNLTLVTGSMNSSLSNDKWSVKVRTLNNYSILLLNAELQSESEWNETAIQKRNKELFSRAVQVWPFPGAK